MNGPDGANPIAQIAIVRVLTAAGPYACGDVLSVAFTTPGIGRLRSHDGRTFGARPAGSVPEVVSAVVLWEAEPYAAGQILTLSFVDPTLARIHCQPVSASNGAGSAGFEDVRDAVAEPVRTAPPIPGLPLSLRLRWSPDRVRRFVQVCDKLFTVERLGWYRHSLVLRLLVPDDVVYADEAIRAEAAQRLEALRAAVAETLGNPLLAAFMPNFGVTPEWLASLETGEIARGLAGFRGAVAPHVGESPPADPGAFEKFDETSVTLSRSDLLATPFNGIDAGLALLVPHVSAATALSDALGDYRVKLGELFGQMAETPERVRLKQMTQPNHVLDDRLWQLVSAVQQTFEPAPAA